MEQLAYAEMYEEEDRHWWFRGRRALIWALLRRANLAGNLRMLDAGCGTGRNLVEFRPLGPAVGVDPSVEAVAFCHQRGLDRVAVGGLEALPFEPGRFDLMFALDVIEHVPDDRGALDELGRVAADGACLVLTVPAYSWLWSEHDVQLHHLRRYTLGRLTRLVVAAGWRPAHATYFNSILLPAVAAARFVSRRSARRGRTDFGRTPRSVNSALEIPMRIEAVAVRRGARLPAGVSIGLVCERSSRPHDPATWQRDAI